MVSYSGNENPGLVTVVSVRSERIEYYYYKCLNPTKVIHGVSDMQGKTVL